MKAGILELFETEFKRVNDEYFEKEKVYYEMCGFVRALFALNSITKFERIVLVAALADWRETGVWNGLDSEF